MSKFQYLAEKGLSEALHRLPFLPVKISTLPWLRGFVLATLRRRRWKTKEIRFVWSCVENPAASETGHLFLGVVRTRQGWTQFARDAFARVSDAVLARYALPEAVEALTGSDPERARSLLRDAISTRAPRFSREHRLSLAVASAYLGFEDGVRHFTAGFREPRVESLKRLFAEQKRAARKLGVSADYLFVREASLRASGITRGTGGDELEGNERSENKTTGPIRIGLFDYRSPVGSSENLGDFIQTLGVVGQLSRFTFDKLTASKTVRGLLAEGRCREGEATQSVKSAVEIVPVNRDFPLTVAADGPIWLPVCGRFGVQAYPGRFDFPFPGNIRPLFMAFHIADPQLLDEESLAYLRRFEPIGCRDLFTARLLRGAGVKAFFNGCVAMTLDRLRPPHTGSRKGKYSASSRKPDGGFAPSPHGAPECLVRDFDGNLRAGLALLDKYRAAEEVRTERLYGWLPCRAMGVPATLKIAGETRGGVSRADPRLDGLLDLDNEAFRDIAARFEAIAQPVLSAALEGKGEAEVYALWREVTAPAMARTDAMIAERNAQYPLPKVSLESLGLGRTEGAQKGNGIPVQTFGAEREPESDEVHLLFSFDANLAEHFPGTFEGVWRHASRPLTVHIFGRGLDAAMFERWAAIFPGVRFIHCDLSGFAYGDGLRFSKGRGHAVSMLDYLLAPELLPDVKKLVYLDVDVLVRKDVAELFDTDLGDAPLAARCSMHRTLVTGVNFLYDIHRDSSISEERRETLRNIFFSGGATVFEWFNTGILVMDLARMRSERAVEKMIALVRTFGIGRDEIALNLYARERRKSLAREWNHTPFRNPSADLAVIHFGGPAKPWSDLPLPFSEEWRENAKRAGERSILSG